MSLPREGLLISEAVERLRVSPPGYLAARALADGPGAPESCCSRVSRSQLPSLLPYAPCSGCCGCCGYCGCCGLVDALSDEVASMLRALFSEDDIESMAALLGDDEGEAAV